MINVIIILAVILAGGVSYSAEGTLPGDALYSIKVGVNEKVQGWLAFSEEAESRLAAKLAIRRLEEAEELAAQNRLDAETKARLGAEFKAQAEEADREIEELEAEGKTEEAASIRTELEASVRARGNVLGIVKLESEAEGEAEAEIEVEGEGRMKIKTSQGEIDLKHENGRLKLSATLMRSTPCIDWRASTIVTKDNPPSNVTFEITKRSTAEVCIQILGEPQEISAQTPAAKDANITVKLEGKVIFSGKMK